MDANQEIILKELTNLDKNPNEVEQIPEILEKYLNNVARSGDIMFKWEQIRAFLKKKVEKTVIDFNDTYPHSKTNQPNVEPFDFDEIKRNILNGIDSFTGAPFTIQRICELLVDPYRHYKRADKFMKGLEKNVLVVSEGCEEYRSTNGNATSILCLNSTFTLPSTSDSTSQQSPTFQNGYKENESESSKDITDTSTSHETVTTTVHQLDSFTTVFVSVPNASPLERMASLPIPDSSPITTTCSASSSQTNITITQSASIDNSLNTETPQLEQQSTESTSTCANTENTIIDTVNDEVQMKTSISLEQNSEEVVSVSGENENQSTNAKLTMELLNATDSIDQMKDEISNELVNSDSTIAEPNSIESTDVNLEQYEKVTTECSRTPDKNQLNELKRMCESPDEETMKRFKSHEMNEFFESGSVEPTLESDNLIVDAQKSIDDRIESEQNSEEDSQSKDDHSEEASLSNEVSVSIDSEITEKQQTQIESSESPNEAADESKSESLEEENRKTDLVSE